MSRRSSFGVCKACGARTGKAAMLAHLRKCLPATTGGVPSEALLVRAQAPGAPMFWLDCAVNPEAKLKELDKLLRRTWLECCGHLSEFYEAGRGKISMSTRVGDALDFLPKQSWYVASIYADAADAHWETNPMAYDIQTVLVNNKTTLDLKLAAGGGAAISLKPATADDMKKWKEYGGKK